VNAGLLCRKLLIFASFLSAGLPARATIIYQVSLAHSERHIFNVRMWIPDVSEQVTLQMPAWNALYQIRDFSSRVRELSARAGSEAADMEKIDKQTWRIKGKGIVTVSYAIYWDEAGPFATQLTGDHAFINPAMVLMYVPERRSEGVSLSLSDIPDGWMAASAAVVSSVDAAHVDYLLGKEGAHTRAFVFGAANYDALADEPIEVGKFEQFEIPGVSPPISVVVHGDKWNKKEFQEQLRRICSYEVKLMDGAPYQHYTFIVHVGKGVGGGGMEHANSTAISIRTQDDFPNVAAHEFFHLWNVKRIRPATLEPVDYTKEQYTRALWFAEGVTSTYAAYTLVRTQIWSKEQFYFDFGEQISELEGRPANQWQSAEQSSLDAWLEKYSIYNRPQDSVSYYTKGQILGVLLDILIRDRTNNEKSLDDVLRAMNTEFAKENKAYRDSLDVRLTAEKVAHTSFESFFQKYVAHAEPLPYAEMLPLAGLQLRTTEHKRAALGFSAERDFSGMLTVHDVDSESSAERSGLRSGDVITVWNGSEPPRSPERWVYSQKPDNSLRLTVRREDKEVTLEIRLSEVSETFYQVNEDGHASEKARRIREGLLHGTTQPVTARLR
jgi:predicted metalloprotease with PDZ domain